MVEKLGINGPLLGLQILHFVLLLVLLRVLLYKPILNMMRKRTEQIQTSLAEADKVRQQAATERATLEAQIAEERRSSQDRLRMAVARGEEAAERRLAEANTEAEQLLARARAEAEQTRAQALAGMQNDIAELALMAAGKVLGEAIDASKHRKLVDGFLSQKLGELA
ncbi:MAG: F0F1 ATP synthase subunit B [Anaerolineae bacterium]